MTRSSGTRSRLASIRLNSSWLTSIRLGAVGLGAARLGAAWPLAIAALLGCESPPPEPVPIAAQRAAYDAPVIDYLESLGDDSIGEELDGVQADPAADPPSGVQLLEGATYLGRVPDLPLHVHVHLVRPDDLILAYLWVDTAGSPFPLPECDPGRVGFRARRIWGTIYTWKSAQPGDGVLISECPSSSWIETAGRARSDGG